MSKYRDGSSDPAAATLVVCGSEVVIRHREGRQCGPGVMVGFKFGTYSE